MFFNSKWNSLILYQPCTMSILRPIEKKREKFSYQIQKKTLEYYESTIPLILFPLQMDLIILNFRCSTGLLTVRLQR